jgi:hypothetical protein
MSEPTMLCCPNNDRYVVPDKRREASRLVSKTQTSGKTILGEIWKGERNPGDVTGCKGRNKRYRKRTEVAVT